MDTADQHNASLSDSILALRLLSVMAVPLVSKQRPQGVLSFHLADGEDGQLPARAQHHVERALAAERDGVVHDLRDRHAGGVRSDAVAHEGRQVVADPCVETRGSPAVHGDVEIVLDMLDQGHDLQ